MKGLLLIVGVLVVIAGVVYVVTRTNQDPLMFYGTIETRDVQVGSLVGGRVAEILAEEGDRVAAGQTILKFESDLLEPQVREQEARVEQARAALDAVLTGPRREAINRARIEWERAEKERKRIEALLAPQLGSQQDYDNAEAAAASALEVYEELKRGSRSEDERQAQAVLDQAEQRLAYMREQLDELVVQAPADGIIESLDLRPGDLVAATQPVASILEPDQLWVRVYVPETQLGLVRVGQAASLEVDTFPGRSFEGTVTKIYDRAEYTPRNIQTQEQREDQVFAVKISVIPCPELKPGMAAAVQLTAGAIGR